MTEETQQTTEIAHRGGGAIAPAQPAGGGGQIMDMISAVVARGGDMTMVRELWTLKKEVDAYQARNAFNAAFAKARAEIPEIKKNRRVFYQHKNRTDTTEYMHEDLAEVVRTVTPILGKYGMSFNFDVQNAVNEPVRVTCILRHEAGHEERTTLVGGRDDSGNKNALQQAGSTITYLQRYTLKAALGLAAAADDDGIASGGDSEQKGAVSDEQYEALMNMATEEGAESGDLQQLCKVMGIDTLRELQAGRYGEAVNHIKEFGSYLREQAKPKTGARK